jgi:hypothetical protein
MLQPLISFNLIPDGVTTPSKALESSGLRRFMVKKDGAIVVNTPHPIKNDSFILPKLNSKKLNT